MATYYWVGGTGTWSGTGNTQFAATSGGVATLLNPTSADTVNFDANSGTAATVTVTATAVSLSTTVNKADINLSLSGSPTLCTTAGTLTLTLGTLTLNTFTLTIGKFASNNVNTRSIAFGTGNITLTGNAALIVSMQNVVGFTYSGTPTVNATYAGSTGTRSYTFGSQGAQTESQALPINVTAGSDAFTFTNGSRLLTVNFTGYSGLATLGTGTFQLYGGLTLSSGMTIASGGIAFSSTSATPRTITTANKTLDFLFTMNGVGGTFAFQDALTQGATRAFTITNGTVQFKDGVTSTVGVFATSSTTRKFLQSTLAGTQATLSQASGTVNAAYLDIQDINATGGATWNAFTTSGNVDAGDNTGWNFGGTPDVDTEVGYRLRSFTQPRRF
jgi:hypothetical protein